MMKKTKLNPKHLYAIFAFLLSAVVAFCGVQIWQEYSSRQKDIDAFAELAERVEIKEPDEPKEATELRNGEDTDGEDDAPALNVRHDIPLLVSRNSDCIGWIWYDATHRQTEAEKMVEDYNNGLTVLNDASLACVDTGCGMTL